MTGQRPNCYWLMMWRYLSPAAIVVILLASIIKMAVSGITYDAWNAVTVSICKYSKKLKLIYYLNLCWYINSVPAALNYETYNC